MTRIYVLQIIGFLSLFVSNDIHATIKTNIGGVRNWNTAGTWSPSGVPGASDTVVIINGIVALNSSSAVCQRLVVGDGVSGTHQLSFSNSTVCNFTVGGDVIINANANLMGPTTGGITTNTLTIGGNLTNNGKLDLGSAPNNTGAGLIFNSTTADQSFTCSVSSITELRQVCGSNGGLHIAKSTRKLTFTPAGTFSVQEVNTLGFLTIASGTFEIAGSSSFTNPVWNTAAYTIPSGTTLILNNANFTVSAQNANAQISGTLQIISGTYNVGTAANQSLTGSGTLKVDGGALNVAGYLYMNGTGSVYNQSGGTLTVPTVGNSTTGSPSFGAGVNSGTSCILSGGTIILPRRNTDGSFPVDVLNLQSLTTVTGGTLQIGDASTTNGSTFVVVTSVYNLTFGKSTLKIVSRGTGADDNIRVVNLNTVDATNTIDLANRNFTCTGSLPSTLSLITSLGNSGTANLKASGTENINISGSNTIGLTFDQSAPGTSNRIANLTFANNVTLSNALQLTGALTPTSGTLTSAGYLTLVSNASGTASVATGSGTVSGNVNVQRYVSAVARRWRFMSSPVSNASLEDWRGEVFITGEGTGNTIGTLNSNGFDASSSNNPGVAIYNEANTQPNTDSGWTFITNNTSSLTNVPLTTGVGYRLFIRGDRSSLNRLNGTDNTQNAVTLDVTGTLVSGDVIMPVSYTSSATSTADGWCLLGNPYASAISWDAIHDAGRFGGGTIYNGTYYTRLSQFVYVYDPASNSYKSYNALTNSGTLTAGIIPSGSAFFVKAAAAPTNLTIAEVHKTSSAPIVLHKHEVNEMMVTASSNSINYDECILKYSNDATSYIDDYDTPKFFNTDINIGTYCGGTHLTLDTRAVPGSLNDSFMLVLTAKASGNYKLVFSNTESFAPGYRLTLIDRFSGTITNLRETNSYTVNIDKLNAASQGQNRLMIVVSREEVGVNDKEGDAEKTSFSLYPTVTENTARIYCNRPVGKTAGIRVYDISGKLAAAYENCLWENNGIAIDLSLFEQGMYFIEVISAGADPVVLRCIRR